MCVVGLWLYFIRIYVSGGELIGKEWFGCCSVPVVNQEIFNTMIYIR